MIFASNAFWTKIPKAVIVHCYIPSDSLKPRQTAGNEAQSAVSTDYFTQYYIVLRVSWGQVDGSSWTASEADRREEPKQSSLLQRRIRWSFFNNVDQILGPLLTSYLPLV